MCISYQNPTQRQQNSDEATCNARLVYSSPALTFEKQRRLDLLAQSGSPRLRASAAGNPMTSESTLWQLADDPDVHVRSWVVRNPQVSDELLRHLCMDSSEGIQAYAKFRLDMRAEVSV